ncbi:hypothetical protein NBRC116188_19770 [Oceaniserpentilla sp. 4NH20-0058]|uniref:hypothetical protein n=1 Tax=Oceaniserpentilla sp. 4NH20-0058 TaxID=3127660 RepID=UPI0031039CDD
MAKSKGGMNQKQLDHHANQLNPNNPAFTARMNNHSNQLNPNNLMFNGGTSGVTGNAVSPFDFMRINGSNSDQDK